MNEVKLEELLHVLMWLSPVILLCCGIAYSDCIHNVPKKNRVALKALAVAIILVIASEWFDVGPYLNEMFGLPRNRS